MKRQTMEYRVNEYLKLRRSLGFQMRHQSEILLKFARHMKTSNEYGPLTIEAALSWANKPHLSRSTRAKRLSALRCFARYLAARDDETEIPGRALVPKVCFRQQPHLYSPQELEELLAATDRLQPQYPVKRLLYRTLFGLLACTGLRISESLKLNGEHIDLQQGVLRVEQTKFKKSRLVPLHPTATQALQDYAQARYGRLDVHDDSPFFINKQGSRLTYCAVRWNFSWLRNLLGWTHGNGDWPRPRIHDLRHTFACQRFLDWYRRGEDVHHLIAALSTYLGHGKVTDTYWYLTSTPDLLAIAGSRFELFAGVEKGERS